MLDADGEAELCHITPSAEHVGRGEVGGYTWLRHSTSIAGMGYGLINAPHFSLSTEAVFGIARKGVELWKMGMSGDQKHDEKRGEIFWL